MNLKFKKISLLLILTAIVLFISIPAAAQKRKATKKSVRLSPVSKTKLRSGVTVKGSVSAKTYDGYSIRARKGHLMIVRVTPKNNGKVSLKISQTGNFSRASQVGGSFSERGRRWAGKIPATGTYYIFVFARPFTNYTLRALIE